MGSDFDQTLESVEVEVICPQSASDSHGKCRFTVKIGSNDTFRKIKKHITECLDTQGKLIYGKYNCDESPLKKGRQKRKAKKGRQDARVVAKSIMLAIHVITLTIETCTHTDTEEVQSEANVFIQHATFETLHQIGKHFEQFKKDRRKSLSIECRHSINEENKVNIQSK